MKPRGRHTITGIPADPRERSRLALQIWGVVCGVASILSLLFLVLFFAFGQTNGRPNDAWYWTGTANDILSIVASGALIPVAFALLALVRGGIALRLLTYAAVVGMVVMALATLWRVFGLIDVPVQAAIALPATVLTYAWLLTVSVRGLRARLRVRSLWRFGVVIGILLLAGFALAPFALLFPVDSAGYLTVFAISLIPALSAGVCFPIWLVLSAAAAEQVGWPLDEARL